ncbi:cold-inducible RNA-binding protein, partial [Pseudomassariella vexata]
MASTAGRPGEFKIFVKGLSSAASDESLRRAFSRFGLIVSTHIQRDRWTGHSRNFGFVTFRNHADAEKALESMN